MKTNLFVINKLNIGDYINRGKPDTFEVNSIGGKSLAMPPVNHSDPKGRIFYIDDFEKSDIHRSQSIYKSADEFYGRNFRVDVVTTDGELNKFFFDIYSFVTNQPYEVGGVKFDTDTIKEYFGKLGKISETKNAPIVNLETPVETLMLSRLFYEIVKVCIKSKSSAKTPKTIRVVTTSNTHGNFVHLLTSLFIANKLILREKDSGFQLEEHPRNRNIFYIFNGGLIEHTQDISHTCPDQIVNMMKNAVATVYLANEVFKIDKTYFIAGVSDSNFAKSKVFNFKLYYSLRFISNEKYITKELVFKHCLKLFDIPDFKEIISKRGKATIYLVPFYYSEHIPTSYNVISDIQYALKYKGKVDEKTGKEVYDFTSMPIIKLIKNILNGSNKFYFLGHDSNYERINNVIKTLRVYRKSIENFVESAISAINSEDGPDIDKVCGGKTIASSVNYVSCTDTYGSKISSPESMYFTNFIKPKNSEELLSVFKEHTYHISNAIYEETIVDAQKNFNIALRRFIIGHKNEILKIVKPRFLFQLISHVARSDVNSSSTLTITNGESHGDLWRNTVSIRGDKDLIKENINGSCFAGPYYPTTSFSRYGQNFLVVDTKTKSDVVVGPHDIGYIKAKKNGVYFEDETYDIKKATYDFENNEKTGILKDIHAPIHKLTSANTIGENDRKIFMTTYSNIDKDLFAILYDSNKYKDVTYDLLTKTLTNENSTYLKVLHLINALTAAGNNFSKFFNESTCYFEYRLADVDYDNIYDIKTTTGIKGTHKINSYMMAKNLPKYYVFLGEALELIVDDKLKYPQQKEDVLNEDLISLIKALIYGDNSDSAKKLFNKCNSLFEVFNNGCFIDLELYQKLQSDEILTHNRRMLERGDRNFDPVAIECQILPNLPNVKGHDFSGVSIRPKDYLTIMKYKNPRIDWKNFSNWNNLKRNVVNHDVEKHFIELNVPNDISYKELFDAYDEKYFFGGEEKRKHLRKCIIGAIVMLIAITVIVAVIVCVKNSKKTTKTQTQSHSSEQYQFKSYDRKNFVI